MKKFLKVIVSIIILAIFINILHGSIISFAWGDSNGGRPSYSLQDVNEGKLGDKIVFNSITIAETDYTWYKTYGKDIPAKTITHEKNYVAAREDADTSSIWYDNDIQVEDGGQYIIRLYVHNNNPNSEKAVAKNTKVYFNIPTESSTQVKVNGYIHADNADPTDYVDYVNFNSDHMFHLEYIYNSALIENNGAVNDTTLSDDIVSPSTGGVLIGYDALDGNIPGGDQYISYITIKVKVVFDKEFYVENKVRLENFGSDPTWKREVDAEIGDLVEFQMKYENLSDVRQPNVGVRFDLSENLRYVEGSTYLYNTVHPNGAHINEDTVIDNGVNIGNYLPGANAYLRITAEVVGDTMADEKNTLVTWAQAQAGPEVGKQIVLQDYAKVNVYKEPTVLKIFGAIQKILIGIIAVSALFIVILKYKIYKLKKKIHSK